MANNLGELKKEEIAIQNMFWSSDELCQALEISLFKKLPNEILLRIFRYLSVSDLCNISLVCRLFKMVGDQDELWKYKFNNTSIKLNSKSYRQISIKWMHEKSLRNKKLLELLMDDWSRTACVIIFPPFSSFECPSTYPKRSESKYTFQPIGGFHQHPNSTQNMTIELSVDIDNTARELISLLKKAIPFEKQYKQSFILKQMIQRYYRFLQLKASHPSDTLLIPTIDIEIVWQTHLLRPEMYRNDCIRLFHRMIDHSLILKNNMKQYFKTQAFFDTCQLYQKIFREEYCLLPSVENKNQATSYSEDNDVESIDEKRSIYTYWDKTYFKFSLNSPKDYENPFSFTEADIMMDLKWFDLCEQFLSTALDKIAHPYRFFHRPSGIDLTSGALKRLKKYYERFLYMAAKYPLKDGNGFIPPTYAIDIIWHSHMQQPLKYEIDCLRLVGYIIYHDPWPITEDKKMRKSCDKTDQIWKNEFQCELTTDHLYNTWDNRDNWFG